MSITYILKTGQASANEQREAAVEIERLQAELREVKETAYQTINNFDAAIRRIATELTTKACGGVDTGNEINTETGEPYGPGGHTGWLLSEEAKKLKAELREAKKRIETISSANLAAEWRERAEAAETKNASLTAQVAVFINFIQRLKSGLACYMELPSDCWPGPPTTIIKEIEEALANAPAEAEKLVRLVKAALAHYEKHDCMEGLPSEGGCRICSAVRDLRGEK